MHKYPSSMEMLDNLKKYAMPLAEIGRRLGVSRQAVYKWKKTGKVSNKHLKNLKRIYRYEFFPVLLFREGDKYYELTSLSSTESASRESLRDCIVKITNARQAEYLGVEEGE